MAQQQPLPFGEPCPFTGGTGPVGPFAPTANKNKGNNNNNSATYYNNLEAYCNTLAYYNNSRNHSLGHVPPPRPAADLSPGDWLQSKGLAPGPDAWSSYMSDDPFAFAPTPPSLCGSMTSAPTAATTMTRTNSAANQSVSGGLQMLRLDSQSSTNGGLPSSDYASLAGPYQGPLPTTSGNKRRAPGDDALLGMNGHFPVVPNFGYPDLTMSRTASAESHPPRGFNPLLPIASSPAFAPADMTRAASMDSRQPPGFNSRGPPAFSAVDMNRAAVSMDSRQPLGPIPRLAGAVPPPSPFSPLDMSRTNSMGSQQSMGCHQPPRGYTNPANVATGQTLVGQSQPMIRSDSTQSGKSTNSQSDRAKDALQRQIAQAGAQPLAPKPKKSPSKADLAPNPTAETGADAETAMPKKGSYKRKKTPKVFCQKCNDYPEGFRGEHELNRHDQAKHQVYVKKWFAVNPRDRGRETDYKVSAPLEKCAHCAKGKHYGKSYNVTAHLRRAHFQEAPEAQTSEKEKANEEERATKKRKAGKKGKAIETGPAQKGGDKEWPPNDELLANWVRSVVVKNPEAVPDEDEKDEAEDDEAENNHDESDLHGPAVYLNPPAAGYTGYDNQSVVFGTGGNSGIGNENPFPSANFGLIDPAFHHGPPLEFHGYGGPSSAFTQAPGPMNDMVMAMPMAQSSPLVEDMGYGGPSSAFTQAPGPMNDMTLAMAQSSPLDGDMGFSLGFPSPLLPSTL